ncbi:MAG: transposase [Acidobacteria bacterium]|nr:transposase [Acidobacteriota bacterium]
MVAPPPPADLGDGATGRSRPPRQLPPDNALPDGCQADPGLQADPTRARAAFARRRRVFGKGTAGWFFGFKLHVITTHSGQVLCGALTAANTNERDVAEALAQAVEGGIVLCDGGYRSARLARALTDEAELLLITPQESGARRALVSSLRERVETTFSQLWARFVDRVFSRSWHGLWNTIKLKMLHYNLCCAGLLSA